MMVAAVPNENVTRLSQAQIETRLRVCNPLPSLHSTNESLHALLAVEQHYTSEISDIIRHDPSLSTRLLQLVNSVYFGLAGAIKTVEEAVLYVGLEQIRQLALITPVIEDFKALVASCPFAWSSFWDHCIGTALMTREILVQAGDAGSEADYLAGLLHDMGKIAMASVFPRHFVDVQQCIGGGLQNLREVERFVLGVDHCELGAAYLMVHPVPEVFVECAAYHHNPELAPNYPRQAAAVYLADHFVRHAGVGQSSNSAEVHLPDVRSSAAWEELFGEDPAAFTSLLAKLQRLPRLLEGMKA